MSHSQPFKVDGWTVFRTLLTSTGAWPIWTAVASGVFLIIFGCIYDLRYLAAGLMITVAVVPGISAILYFSHTLSPYVVGNMIPHTVERTKGGYLLRILRHEDIEEGNTCEDEKEERWVESSVISLSDTKIVERKTYDEYELFYYKDSSLKILYVPRLKK